MERLTKRIGNSVAYSEFNSNNSDGCYEMMDNCLHKLAEYEDAEEQGELLRLPCKVGTQVWKIKKCFGGGRIPNWHEIYNVNFALELLSDFGKTVFLTKEEAEQALAEMKGE